MAKKNSSSKRTLELYRNMGYECQVVERWNPHAFKRQDLFGFIDILALCPHRGIVGLQVTTQGEVPAHIAKILAEPRSQKWLNAGGMLHLVEWKKPGKKNRQWMFRVYPWPVNPNNELPEWRIK